MKKNDTRPWWLQEVDPFGSKPTYGDMMYARGYRDGFLESEELEYEDQEETFSNRRTALREGIVVGILLGLWTMLVALVVLRML